MGVMYGGGDVWLGMMYGEMMYGWDDVLWG